MSSQLHYSGVIFDMDDTLLSRRAAFRHYAEGFYDRQDALHETPKTEAIDWLVELDDRGDNDKGDYFRSIKTHWPGIEDSVDTLIDDYWPNLVDAVVQDPTSNQFLQELNDAEVSWGILTNGPGQFQRAKLAKTGLGDLAPFAVVSGEFGVSKPEPEVFHEALSRIRTPPESTLFVGDNPIADIRGARNVGMPTAWMRAGRKKWTESDLLPTHQVDHISELRDFLIH